MAATALNSMVLLQRGLGNGGDNKWNASSPTWSGTDAGSPDNYFLLSWTLRYRNGRVFFRIGFGASGNYANRGAWITANGSTILAATTKFTRQDGTVLQPLSNVTIAGGSTSTSPNIAWTMLDSNGTWAAGLVAGDTFNIQIDW